MVVDFRHPSPPLLSLSIEDISMETVHRKGLNRIYFPRRLLMFYQSVMASVLFYHVVRWGGVLKGETGWLMRKASSVVVVELEALTSVVVKTTLRKLMSIMDNDHHPLHRTLSTRKTVFSGRLLLACTTERLRRFFVPWAIQPEYQKDRGVMDWWAWVCLPHLLPHFHTRTYLDSV